jgi:hypothetical protein
MFFAKDNNGTKGIVDDFGNFHSIAAIAIGQAVYFIAPELFFRVYG